jgi:hypothetical protein
MLLTGNTCARQLRCSAALPAASTQMLPAWSPTHTLLPTAVSAVMPPAGLKPPPAAFVLLLLQVPLPLLLLHSSLPASEYFSSRPDL